MEFDVFLNIFIGFFNISKEPSRRWKNSVKPIDLFEIKIGSYKKAFPFPEFRKIPSNCFKSFPIWIYKFIHNPVSEFRFISYPERFYVDWRDSTRRRRHAGPMGRFEEHWIRLISIILWSSLKKRDQDLKIVSVHIQHGPGFFSIVRKIFLDANAVGRSRIPKELPFCYIYLISLRIGDKYEKMYPKYCW